MSVEIWSLCPSYPTMMASNLGNVKHLDAEHPRSTRPGLAGYILVGFYHDGRRIARNAHELVADAWLGPRPKGMQICHIDGNRSNNRADNLRYGTAKDNAQDRIAHGRNPHGERNGMARLPEAGVRVIRAAYAAGVATQYELADLFGISQAQVNNIVLNKQRRRAA